jgi:site-specific DNA recombinase
MKRAAIYARISEKDDEFDKVELQRERLKKFALDNDYTVVFTFDDEGVSGWSGKSRPGWFKLLAAISAKKIDVVLAVAEDRLTRNSQEKVGFQVECAKADVTWHTIAGGMVDPKDASGGLLGTITGALAEYESNIKSMRLRARFEAETASGRPLWGIRPFGYNADRMTLEKDEAALLSRAYKTIQNGGSIYSIIRSWNEAGVLTTKGNKWSYATVQSVLKRPRNAGIVMRNDVEQVGVKAQWEPVIDRSSFEAVRAILTDQKRRTATGRKQSHLSAGLAFCGVCGAPMRSASVKLKGVTTPIYKCAAKANAQAVGERHPTIQTNMLDPLVRSAVIDAFMVGPSGLLTTEDLGTGDLEADLSKVRASRQKILNLVLADVLEEGDAAGQLKDIKTREAKLEAAIDAAHQKSAHASMTVDLRKGLFSGKKVSWTDSAKVRGLLEERFDSLPLLQQRELVRTMLSVTLGLGRSLSRVQIEHRLVESLNAD